MNIKRILIKASVPPLVALIIIIGIITVFPQMTEKSYIILLVIIFTLSQLIFSKVFKED